MSDLRDLDSLRLHPDAEKVPLPDAADLRALRESLRENGQQDPIDLTPDGVILDGRTRWTLLRELGAESIHVRIQDIPEGQQAAYMVDRAVARRHLTTHQKKDLNDRLRVAVVEERPTKRGNVMRIGHSQTQRAGMLGVDLATVKRWEAEPLVSANAPTSPLPTHAIDGRGRPQPLHKIPSEAMPARADKKVALSRPRALDITNGGRNLNVANAAKDRLTGALSQMAGLCRGLQEINYANAVVAASEEEIANWGTQISGIGRSLRAIGVNVREARK